MLRPSSPLYVPPWFLARLSTVPVPRRTFPNQQLSSLHAQRRMGDLNNTEAARERLQVLADPEYRFRSFPIHALDDDPAVRQRYRPFLLDDEVSSSDWITKLELATAAKMVETKILSQGKDRLRVLVLYGSLRSRFVTSSMAMSYEG